MTRRRAPGPRGLPLSGNLWHLGVDALGFLSSIEARFGPVAQARIGHQRYHLISDPDLAEQVLWRRAERYTRATSANSKLTDITGASLLTSVGPAWLERRKLIAPFFTRERMLAQQPLMATLGQRHIELWAAAAGRREALDATAALMAATCAIASQVLFGTVVEDPRLGQALDDILAHHWKRLVDPWQLAHRLPTRSRRAFDHGNLVVAEVIAQVATTTGTGTLLGALRTASGGTLDLQVADELITLLIAGHETTANALSWALYLLAEHPEQQELLRAEAHAIADPSTATLPLATRVFQEALRLYPPIWLIERQALVDDEVGGYHIPAGSTMLIAPWVMHRAPRWWIEPTAFQPQRFLQTPPKHVYIPFGIGPHACVGASLALIEGPLLLALAARRWRWRLAPRTRVVPRPGLTLRMKNPLRLVVEAV